MKKIILAVCIMLGILGCNEDETFENKLKPDNEMIAKLITGFDDTVKIVLSSNENISDKQIDDIYLDEITRLGITLKNHSTQPSENSDKNTGYSSEFINFVLQIQIAPQFESKNAYKTHLAYLNSAVLNSKSLKSKF